MEVSQLLICQRQAMFQASNSRSWGFIYPIFKINKSKLGLKLAITR